MGPSIAKPFLAMLPVRNEAGRYLSIVLKHLSALVEGIVVLDDGSTDETPRLCREHHRVVRFHRLEESQFEKNEATLRKLLWEMTVELNPSWILALDADEIFENRIIKDLPSLISQDRYHLIQFPVYHFWGSFCQYRVDGLWNPLFSKIACLYRYNKNLDYHWSNRKLHCGRFPEEAYLRPNYVSPVRLLHLGYVNRKDHPLKYGRYSSLDPEGKFCSSSHYHSILNPNPRLREWTGEKPEVLRQY